MDIQILYQTATNKLFTDLTLILADEENKIEINVHKAVLYSSCIYFRKLFTNFLEKDSKVITINVPNAYVTHDIIDGFYGQHTNHGNYAEWYRTLQLCKCNDYFGIEFNRDLLFNLNIPEEGFEHLLDILNIPTNDDVIVHHINRTLPKNYDLSKLSPKLIKRMLDCAQYNRLVTVDFVKIKVWKIYSKTNKYELDYTLDDNKYIGANCIRFSHDYKFFAISTNSNISIWNIELGKMVSTSLQGRRSTNIFFTSDNNKIVLTDGEEYIDILDVKSGKTLNSIFKPHYHFSFCTKTNQIAMVMNMGLNSIRFFKLLENNELDETNSIYDYASFITHSPDGTILVTIHKSYINIYNMSGKLVNKIKYHNTKYGYLYFDGNNKIMYTNIGKLYVLRTESSSTDTCEYWSNKIVETVFNMDDHIVFTNTENKLCFTDNIITCSKDEVVSWQCENNQLKKMMEIKIPNVYLVGCQNIVNNDFIDRLQLYLDKN